LLKTLEEPPPHVKFLLATTDPQKLPVTVLSRCLQFNLKRLPASLIAARLSHILGAEGVAFEPAAVQLLARSADGSLRDALSLLDQMLAFGGGRVGEADARAMLGTVDRQQVLRIASCLAERDGRGLFEIVAAIDEFAPDYGQLLDELAALLQKVALRQAVAGLADDEVHPAEALAALADRMPAEDLQLAYQFAIQGRRDLELAPDPRTGFEMTLLRMLAFRPADAASGTRDPAAGRASAAAVPAAAQGSARAAPAGEDWPLLLARLDLKGPARQLAGNCQLVAREGDRFRFLLDERAFALHTRQLEDRFVQALRALVGASATVDIERGGAGDTPARREQQERDERLEKARASLERDPNVQALRDRFGAVLQPDSVKPVG
jgi:DNA polymerase-3 subunit gamma/tau